MGSSNCKSTARLDGKTAIITGCSSGIGKETVLDFYRRGARVILACRSIKKAEEAIEDILETCRNVPNLGELVLTKLDLADLKSVHICAQKILEKEDKINMLINNAGVMACPFEKTKNGFEMQIGTNHFGHFLFTILLMPKIIQSVPARIVTVSSVVSKKHGISGLTVYSLHPGIIATELQRHYHEAYFNGPLSEIKHFLRKFLKTPFQGAQTTIYCAVDEEAGNETGLYYSDCKVAKTSLNAKAKDDAMKLWDISWELVGLNKNYNPFQLL